MLRMMKLWPTKYAAKQKLSTGLGYNFASKLRDFSAQFLLALHKQIILNRHFSPFIRLFPRMNPHVIPELVLRRQYFPTDVAGVVFARQEHLVLLCHMVVLPGLIAMPLANVTLGGSSIEYYQLIGSFA